MSINKEFWDKVYKCKHEWSKNYYEDVGCDTPYCDGNEQHCVKCGVYESICKCGSCNGLSGWSNSHHKTQMKKWEKKSERIRLQREKGEQVKNV